MKHILACSLMYFILVFMIGFVLGIFRVLVLVPRIGDSYAELVEMPFMLVAIYFSARYLLQQRCHHSLLNTASSALYMGMLALLMLLLLEFTLVLSIRGLSLEQYLASRDPVSGGAYVLGLLFYMLAPFILAKKHLADTHPRW